MKRTIGLIAFALLTVGCATSSAVKEQADRITAMEARQSDLDAKLADVARKQDAQAADIQGLRSEMAQTQAAAQKAVADAQDAANRAESAAERSTKAFALGQKKGK
jgi:hypothetical protein